MNKEFIPYEQALELKKLGFDERCFMYYWHDSEELAATQWYAKHTDLSNNKLSAPLYQQAFRFFREKYGYNGVIEGSKRFGFEWCIYRDEYEYIKPPNNTTTYEEAELECLKKLIEIVKGGNK